MEWLWLVGSIKVYVSFAKEPYKRDNILQKRPVILSILLTVATSQVYISIDTYTHIHTHVYLYAHVYISVCVYV